MGMQDFIKARLEEYASNPMDYDLDKCAEEIYNSVKAAVEMADMLDSYFANLNTSSIDYRG